MPSIESFRDVIELWPSHPAMAREVGVARSNVVSKWHDRNRIPSDWWEAVLSTETASSAGLTAEHLTKLAARAEVRA